MRRVPRNQESAGDQKNVGYPREESSSQKGAEHWVRRKAASRAHVDEGHRTFRNVPVPTILEGPSDQDSANSQEGTGYPGERFSSDHESA